MKINITHAVAGVAVLFLIWKVAKARGATDAVTKPSTEPISQAGQWWSYAGGWASQG